MLQCFWPRQNEFYTRMLPILHFLGNFAQESLRSCHPWWLVDFKNNFCPGSVHLQHVVLIRIHHWLHEVCQGFLSVFPQLPSSLDAYRCLRYQRSLRQQCQEWTSMLRWRHRAPIPDRNFHCWQHHLDGVPIPAFLRMSRQRGDYDLHLCSFIHHLWCCGAETQRRRKYLHLIACCELLPLPAVVSPKLRSRRQMQPIQLQHYYLDT